jgi:hypothetical protein
VSYPGARARRSSRSRDGARTTTGEKSEDAGFDFHMVKPIDPTALQKLLMELRGNMPPH